MSRVCAAFVCMVIAAAPASAATPSQSEQLAAQQHRPRVIIRPRRIEPGPNAKRYCQSWLATEYRVSGTVLVPQMRCWWQ